MQAVELMVAFCAFYKILTHTVRLFLQFDQYTNLTDIFNQRQNFQTNMVVWTVFVTF